MPSMGPADCLAATTAYVAVPSGRALRMTRQMGPGFGGWQPAGFGHAYRAEEPRVSLCGQNIDQYHHFADRFDAGVFDRCAECVAYVARLSK
jgi:hypothetical protein